MTELHYIRYRHDVKPREHLTKTVKQSIYFYVYISYNKNISYIVTVTLRPGPGAPQEPDGGGEEEGPGQGAVSAQGASRSQKERSCFYTRNIKSHPKVSKRSIYKNEEI